MPELHISHKPPEYWVKRHARKTNLTGVVVNGFEILGYVGHDWRTSQYAKYRHTLCGTEGTVLAGEALYRLGKRKCRCGKAGEQ